MSSRYTFGINQAVDNVGNANALTLATVKAGSSSGIALTGFYIGIVESGTFASRNWVWRYSADGTGGSTLTPSKFSSRTPAAGVTVHSDYTTADPTQAGSGLILFGTTQGAALIRPIRWILPNPRYAIYEEPSSSTLIGVASQSAVVTISTTVSFAEDAPRSFGFGKMRGRRGIRRGSWVCHQYNHNFEGLSTSPKNGGQRQTYNYVQAYDWPDSLYQPGALMNLLLGAGGLTEAEGSSAGIGAVTGVGGSTAQVDGSSAGVGTPTGVGVGFNLTTGSSDGVATANGVGGYIIAGVGSAAGSATPTADSLVVSTAAASSAGVATATADASARALTTGASAGVATPTAVGSATAGADGASAGVATPTAAGAARALGTGDSAGTATPAAIGAAFALATGASDGVATATAEGADGAATGSDGSSAGQATASGVSGAIAGVIAAADGVATAGATAAAFMASVGATAGLATGTADAQATIAAIASTGGVASANGASGATAGVVGNSDGLATASGEGDVVTGPATITTPMMVVTPSTWHFAPVTNHITQAAIEAETDDCLVIAMAAHYLLTR